VARSACYGRPDRRSSELAACAARVDAGEVSWHHQVHDNVSLILFLPLIAAPLCLHSRSGEMITGALCGPPPSSTVCSGLPSSSST
jgi:hypothetical protein